MLLALSLGSNLEDSAALLQFANNEISLQVGEIVASSSIYQTEPISDVAQEDYLNAVVLVESDLEPMEILDRIHSIEAQAGRTRDVRWGPRTLDIDIIDADGFSCENAELTIPHPRARERAFVLVPLMEVAPDWMLGGVASISELIADLGGQRIMRIGNPDLKTGEA